MRDGGRRRVLLVRMDGVGDALALTPLIAALRDAGHELSAVLSTRNRDMFASGVFAGVHVLERIPWPRHNSTPETYARALAEAREARYDVALVASEEPEAYRFAREAGIAQRVGFVTGFAKPLKSVWAATMLTRRALRPASARRHVEHEAETLFRLGRGLHTEARPTKDARRLRPLILGADAAPHGRVVVQITSKLRGLGVDRDTVRALLRAIAVRSPSVAVCAPAESNEASALIDGSGLALLEMRTADEWKRTIAGAAAVVAPDSGAAHVAGMTGIGCVDLFPLTADVNANLQRWYPWASPRCLPIAVTPSIARRLPEHVVAGVEYVMAPAA